MATRYIDNRATGANNGTSEANAYTSIAAIPSVTAGDVFEFVAGSGPYIESLNIKGNGTLASPITWNVNGCEISSKKNLTDPAIYKWTKSVVGDNIYYVTLLDGTTTGLVTGTTTSNLQCATVNGRLIISSTGANLLQYQFVLTNTITFNKQMARGDADSLGFNTFYIRSDAGNPIGNHSIYAASQNYIMDYNWGYHTFNDAVFTYAHVSLVRSRGLSWVYNNCIFKYADSNAVQSDCTTVSADNTLKVNNPVFYWTGHRAVHFATGIAQVTVDHFTCVGTHLFALIATAPTAGALLTLTNGISAYNQAGCIDNKKLDTSYLVENNNCWYPLFTETSNGLAYINLAGWPETAATDIPASRAGDDAVAANYTAPGFVAYSEFGLELCDLRLDGIASGAAVGAARNWTSTGRRLLDSSGEPYPDYEISMGYLQSKYTPSHPFV